MWMVRGATIPESCRQGASPACLAENCREDDGPEHRIVKSCWRQQLSSADVASLAGMRRAPLLILLCAFSHAYASVSPYAGAIGGISTLSADAGAQRTARGLNLSSYGPANGGALNVFAGAHLFNYFSVQANYIWNRNDLVLNSSGASGFYQQARTSSQYAGILDFLIYFRRRSSWVRPYLGTGTGLIHLTARKST
jgi:hypothetical protein